MVMVGVKDGNTVSRAVDWLIVSFMLLLPQHWSFHVVNLSEGPLKDGAQ